MYYTYTLLHLPALVAVSVCACIRAVVVHPSSSSIVQSPHIRSCAHLPSNHFQPPGSSPATTSKKIYKHPRRSATLSHHWRIVQAVQGAPRRPAREASHHPPTCPHRHWPRDRRSEAFRFSGDSFLVNITFASA